MERSPAPRMPSATDRPPSPEGIERTLRAFRRRMRREKVAEAAALSAIVVSLSFLASAGLDRLVETPAILRGALSLAALGFVLVTLPAALNRWVLRHRSVADVAREVALRDARTGDRLLGVIELAGDADEFRRSPSLVRAAIARAERDLGARPLDHALPPSRHRALLAGLVLPAAAVAALFALLPEVASNALVRWGAPGGGAPRFTFTRIEGAPPVWALPILEERARALRLGADSRWSPATAELRLAQGKVTSPLEAGGYRLVVPPLAEEQRALLVVGDVRRRVLLRPLPRPEVTAAVATVRLPDYLGLSTARTRDVSGGALSAVEGSEVQLTLELSRPSRPAEAPDAPASSTLTAAPVTASAPSASPHPGSPSSASPAPGGGAPEVLDVAWVDELGLEGPRPFRFTVRPVPDGPPEVSTVGIGTDPILIESGALSFDVVAVDDFGVASCGLEWFVPSQNPEEPPMSAGEKVLLALEPGAERAEAIATLRPAELGTASGRVGVRAWATDLLPGRSRSYSAPVWVRVMGEEEHLEWVQRRFERWIQDAAEVRDRELELLATNETLLAMTDAELGTSEARSQLESQVAAERANRARLRALASEGGELLDEAARNAAADPEMLEQWAEARDELEEIAEDDMEVVSKLLASAAGAAAQADTPGGRKASSAGVVRAGGSGDPQPAAEGEEGEESPLAPTPNVLDVESSLAEGDGGAAEPPSPQEPSDGAGTLGLVGTTVPGAAGDEGAPGPKEEEPVREESTRSMTAQQLAKAVEAQRELVEQFNDVAGEIQETLQRLELSTFVKRLKAASRAQAEGAERLAVPVARAFGMPTPSSERPVARALEEFRALQDLESSRLGTLFLDLDAYADRLSYRGEDSAAFYLRVVAEWTRTRPVFLTEDMVASAEAGRVGAAAMLGGYLSDRLDRWADELVPPAEDAPEEQEDEGGTNSESLPPAIILEVLRITEAEMILRDVTREAGQAERAVGEEAHRSRTLALAGEQGGLADRLDDLMNRMRKLPDGSRTFGSEIRMMATARRAMVEAQDLLVDADAGRETVAAQTEAIELLLQSRKAGGSGGGGKGSSPGGGSGGTEASAALALSGRSTGEGEQVEARGMSRAARGEPSRIPVEFVEPLERYFEALESGR